MSNSLWPSRLRPTRLLCPWGSPGKNSGVGCHSLPQGIFRTGGSSPGLMHCRQITVWGTGKPYGFSSSHAWMWELDHKKGWAYKNWCFGAVVLEKTLESPLDSKEIKPVNPKGNQPWIFIGRTDAKAPILQSPDVKSQLIGKKPWKRCWER